jgi:hypothetical protein
LRKSTTNQKVAVLTKDSNEVTDRLSLAPPCVSGKVQSGSSKLGHGSFETNPRPQARLLKHQSASPIFQQIRTLAMLEQPFEFVRPIHDRVEIIDS